MLEWRNKRRKEEMERHRELVELRGRVDKQAQFIDGLARKYPEIANEVNRFRSGWKKPEAEPVKESILV